MEIPEYLTSDQAAKRLGINRQSLYNLASSANNFPAPLKIGRTSLWAEADLDAWRAKHPKRRKNGEAG